MERGFVAGHGGISVEARKNNLLKRFKSTRMRLPYNECAVRSVKYFWTANEGDLRNHV